MALAATHPPAGANIRSRRLARAPGVFSFSFHRLALLASLFTYALIVIGATVRATGSGLGCGNEWPTCNGQWVPPATLAGWIEWTHRAVAGITSPLILGTTVAAWLWRRHDRAILLLATLVPVLLAIQILLGKVVVELDLATMAVMVHLGFALAILGLLVWITVASAPLPRVRPGEDLLQRKSILPHAAVATGLIFVLLLVGAYVRASGATWACAGFPDCNGQGPLPFGQNRLMDIQLTHRLLAYLAVGLVGWVAMRAGRGQRHVPAVRTAARLLAAAIVVQAAIGAVAVSIAVPPLLQAMHVAGASATWAASVALTCLAFRTRHTSLAYANGRPGSGGAG